MSNVSTESAVKAPPRRRPLFSLGVVLFFLGVIIYIVQFNLKQLVAPWYVPVLATGGVLLMGLSAWQRPGILRIAGFVLFALLCAGEWLMVLVGFKTPDYTGPAQPGRAIPTFTTSLADGTAFTNRDLEGNKATVMLFFRGRW